MNFDKRTIFGIVLGVIALVGLCLFLFMGSIKVDVGEVCLTIEGTLVEKKTLYYEDIESVQVVENVDVGLKTMGTETLRTMTGQYHSEQYGAFSLFMYKKVANGIVLTTKAGEIIIFNRDNLEDTIKCCNEINDKLLPGNEAGPDITEEEPESLIDEA